MRSLTRNIFNSIIIASLLTLVTTFALIMGVYYNNISTLLLNEMTEEANYISHGIKTFGTDFLNGLDSGNELLLISSDGTIVFSTDLSVSSTDLIDSIEIADAAANGTGTSILPDEIFTGKILHYAVRLDDGSILRISNAQPTLVTIFSFVFSSLLILTIAVIILSAILANRMSASIVKPISELDISTPDESAGYRELAPLVKRIRSQNSFISRQMNELRSKHEEFTAITENMSEGFLLIDENREIISFNSSARRILDLGHESNVIDRNDVLDQAVSNALAGKRDEREASFGGSDYRIITSPVLNGKNINGAVAIILDITEKIRREAMRREFTSNVSHELKTPLTSINAAAEMLSGGIVASQDLDRFYGMIQNESARLITLINDILRISQLDENAIVDETVTLSLREITENVAEILSSAAEGKGVTMTINGNAEIKGVPTIIEEMIFNLCDNAIKYNQPDGKVEINIIDTKDTAVLSVSDTGIGIPQEMHERIFERFYRVDKSRSKEIGGTGLGLSIVRHAANYHNADISVESTLGKGTVITVKFNK